MLKATLYTGDCSEEPLVLEGEYTSLVSRETYGVPPLIAPKDGRPPVAKVKEKVIYINTSLVPLFIIERIKDATR